MVLEMLLYETPVLRMLELDTDDEFEVEKVDKATVDEDGLADEEEPAVGDKSAKLVCEVELALLDVDARPPELVGELELNLLDVLVVLALVDVGEELGSFVELAGMLEVDGFGIQDPV